MGTEKLARLKAGIKAGLVACMVLGFVIWLFGYITGERLAIALLCIISVCVGLISGAQVYISNPNGGSEKDDVLAELQELSQGKALGKSTNVASNKRRGTGKVA